MVKHADGGWAPGDVRTAAVMVPEGSLDQDGMVRVVCDLGSRSIVCWWGARWRGRIRTSESR